ncbi:hypothetical protein AVEN_26496-1 [Araneus ventricosus]|uniref:Uncharacterized protein n=1 Tax=Araneus ventricosus TaxID=182803 RepID=A0A4Y2CUR4_ARAVE|nr:hypothetical protein AVEN_26496-1 [Araneus ventricosus]
MWACCSLNSTSGKKTSSRWCGAEVWRGGFQLSCRPRELTAVQYYEPLDLKDIKKLSTDKQHCLAIKDGSCSSSVTDNSPGELSYARWLIPANRLLWLYTGTPSPLQNLIILVNYVMLVYAPMWFEIKMKSNCQYGA